MNANTRTETSTEAGGQPEPLLLTAEQAGALLGICRTKVYELLRNGQLESVRIGTSRRIPRTALADYVQRLRSMTMVGLGLNTDRSQPGDGDR
jgi:excisionase family DNA binding protein